jgi:probable rRNA maturation factor
VSIEIANESGVPVDETALLAVARHALAEQRVNPMAELSLLVVDEPVMAELNERWMEKTGPTDVLAFPMDELDPGSGPGQPPGGVEEPALIGDVVLCPQVAARQAEGAGHSTLAELEMLTVHGVLHLLGWDHAEPATEREMFTEQDRILRSYRAAARRGAVPG